MSTTRRHSRGPAATKRTKIRFPRIHGVSERVWAIEVGENQYRIQNVPFLQHDVALGDLVIAVAEGDDPAPMVQRVIEPSGHLTVVVAVPNGKMRVLCSDVAALGCSVEVWGQDAPVVAISIPADVDYGEVDSAFRRSSVEHVACDCLVDERCGFTNDIETHDHSNAGVSVSEGVNS